MKVRSNAYEAMKIGAMIADGQAIESMIQTTPSGEVRVCAMGAIVIACEGRKSKGDSSLAETIEYILRDHSGCEVIHEDIYYMNDNSRMSILEIAEALRGKLERVPIWLDPEVAALGDDEDQAAIAALVDGLGVREPVEEMSL